MGSKGDAVKSPKVLKKHSKRQDRESRRTCWRSIKWKIAILCCSSQGRKGNGPYTKMTEKSKSSKFDLKRKLKLNGIRRVLTKEVGSSLINNIFVLAFVFSQVYLLHRFGAHRSEVETLNNMKRSYPLQSQPKDPVFQEKLPHFVSQEPIIQEIPVMKLKVPVAAKFTKDVPMITPDVPLFKPEVPVVLPEVSVIIPEVPVIISEKPGTIPKVPVMIPEVPKIIPEVPRMIPRMIPEALVYLPVQPNIPVNEDEIPEVEEVPVDPVELARIKQIEDTYDGIEYNEPIFEEPVLDEVPVKSPGETVLPIVAQILSAMQKDPPVLQEGPNRYVVSNVDFIRQPVIREEFDYPPEGANEEVAEPNLADILRFQQQGNAPVHENAMENPGDFYLNEGDSDYDFKNPSKF
jgi:hypothetical protein